MADVLFWRGARLWGGLCLLLLNLSTVHTAIAGDPAKQVYFGDLHVHTGWSLDAFAFGVTANPEDAYQFAKGVAIDHAAGYSIQLRRPLDFIAVTDHAEYLGVFATMADSSHPLSRTALAKDLYSQDSSRFERAINYMRNSVFNDLPMTEFLGDTLIKDMWARSVGYAEKHYEPGEFTTFIAYEWSATPDAANLHRNVIFKGGPGEVPSRPFSARDSQSPSKLWSYLDSARASHGDVLAIPHNANLSDGRMFPAFDSENTDAMATAAQRRRNEPVMEITQIKGTSETHPLLSPDDGWADFELLEELMGGQPRKGKTSGSYAREALKQGLLFTRAGVENPYQFGFVGASDSHNASSATEEDNYSGKIGLGDGTPEKRREGGSVNSTNLQYSASGLTGVWAERNTREAIFEALRRREIFATSGSRIILQFQALPQHTGASHIPMGGQVAPSALPIQFHARAFMDPDGARLQRLQLVKGWVQNGQLHESVTDIACSGLQNPDPKTGRCVQEEYSLDINSCEADSKAGSTSLEANWKDPYFDAKEAAFYYLRVLEQPSCRWSSWDALRSGWVPPAEVPTKIQERAWSSPIWYFPEAERKNSALR